MARAKHCYENDSKQLIKNLTHFDEEDENFELCLQYILSNFKYHRFLDVNSHVVCRAFDGYCQKFIIHCQDHKAKALKEKVDDFLQKPSFESQEYGKTDTHYAILSLLLNLAESPTNVTYTEPKKTEKQGEEENFDWRSYLLEEEELTLQDSSDSSWSDDDEDEDSTLDRTSHKKLAFASGAGLTGRSEDGWGDPGSGGMDSPDSALGSPGAADDVLEWLRDNVMVQYWTGVRDDAPDKLPHPSCNLAADWEAYQCKLNSIYVPTPKYHLTEYHLMREMLWLLGGAQRSFIFQRQGESLAPRQDIQLSHVAQESLRTLLTQMALYASAVQELQAFVEVATNVEVTTDADSTLPTCRTYQAFAGALAEYLQSYRTTLRRVEAKLHCQEEIMTLVTLQDCLQERFEEIHLLHSVYTNGVAAFSHVTSVGQRASQLLSVLFEMITEYDCRGEEARAEVSLLLPIWIKTCRPFLDIVDTWIHKGDLIDPYEEFVIQRNTGVRALDETFWDTAFTLLYCQQDSGTSSSRDSTRGTQASQGEGHGNMPWAPGFLIPVLGEVILAGKSMEMLQNLGRLRDVAGIAGRDRIDLYESFIADMEEFLRTDQPWKENGPQNSPDAQQPVAVVPPPGGAVALDHVFEERISQQMALSGNDDPLYRLNFSKIFHPEIFPKDPLDDKQEKLNGRLSGLSVGGLTPIQLLLQKCLYPHIRRQSELVCSRLLQILKEEYHLPDYFAATRRFFLMEAGHVMYDFYTELFDKINRQDSWQDISFLNSCLAEALQEHYPEEINRLFVTFHNEAGSKPRKKHHPIGVLDDLTLDYKVPWPVNIIINSKSIEVYNKVFSFLLQIKRVKYDLDELRFHDLQKEDFVSPRDLEESILGNGAESGQARKDLTHRMQVFRMRLIHFINSLHTYIMTRILHSTGLEFESDIQQAKDLDQVLLAHKTYVKKLYERCLLHKRVSFIREVVTKVMNLALTFAARWHEGVDSYSFQQLTEAEAEVSRCILFLSSFLTNVTKRGSFPHLEFLAFALVTCSEVAKY